MRSRCAARGAVSRNKYPNTNRNPAASALRARWKSCKNLLFYPPTKRMGENEKEKLARRGESSEKDFRRPRLSLRIQILESAMGCALCWRACTMNRPIINTKTMAKKGRLKKCDVSISAFETLRHRIYSLQHWGAVFGSPPACFSLFYLWRAVSKVWSSAHQQCVAAALSLNCDFTVLIRAPIKAAVHSFRIFPFPISAPIRERENKGRSSQMQQQINLSISALEILKEQFNLMWGEN